MKLLFAHDTKIKEDTIGHYYTGGSFNEDVWKRYLSLTSDFTVMARKEPFIYEEDDAKRRFNNFDNTKIKFIEVPNLSVSLKAFFDIKERKKRYAIIKDAVLNCDFLIARIPSDIGNVAINIAKKNNKPYLLEVVGCSWDALWNYNSKGKILAPISYLKQKKGVEHASYSVYVTQHFLQKRYPTKGLSINCSNVSLINLDENIVNKRIEKIINMQGNSKLIIGTTGAVDVRYKGQDTIIKALSLLKKQGNNNFEYQLVGGGDQSYLRSIARDNGVLEQVKFLGNLPHNEVFNWLDTIDIYAQPSKTEGLPRALIEAMSRGVFAIGTSAGGIPELLEEKYVIKKHKNNQKDVFNILSNIEKDDLIEQAKRNYRVSKDYEKLVIESRRQEFLRRFISQK